MYNYFMDDDYWQQMSRPRGYKKKKISCVLCDHLTESTKVSKFSHAFVNLLRKMVGWKGLNNNMCKRAWISKELKDHHESEIFMQSFSWLWLLPTCGIYRVWHTWSPEIIKSQNLNLLARTEPKWVRGRGDSDTSGVSKHRIPYHFPLVHCITSL